MRLPKGTKNKTRSKATIKDLYSNDKQKYKEFLIAYNNV